MAPLVPSVEGGWPIPACTLVGMGSRVHHVVQAVFVIDQAVDA